MALDLTQVVLIVLLGAIIGILYGIRRIYILEYKIERIEEHMENILTQLKRKR